MSFLKRHLCVCRYVLFGWLVPFFSISAGFFHFRSIGFLGGPVAYVPAPTAPTTVFPFMYPTAPFRYDLIPEKKKEEEESKK